MNVRDNKDVLIKNTSWPWVNEDERNLFFKEPFRQGYIKCRIAKLNVYKYRFFIQIILLNVPYKIHT